MIFFKEYLKNWKLGKLLGELLSDFNSSFCISTIKLALSRFVFWQARPGLQQHANTSILHLARLNAKCDVGFLVSANAWQSRNGRLHWRANLQAWSDSSFHKYYFLKLLKMHEGPGRCSAT